MKCLLAILIFSTTLFAKDISVMTFNTMCDFCTSDSKISYSKRLTYIQDVLIRYQSDIIALQEVRTGSQLKSMFKGLSDYHLFYSDYTLFSFADPAIAFKKSRFSLIESGQRWLGPQEGNFSFGWKFSVPRQILWTKLKDKVTNEKIAFITTHLDNRNENKTGSIKVIEKLINSFSDYKIIMAGDINLRKHDELYANLPSSIVNVRDLTQKKNYRHRSPASNLCYSHKGSKFPKCLVDHIFTSKNDFKVNSWTMDLKLYGDSKVYPSDHRPIITTLQ